MLKWIVGQIFLLISGFLKKKKTYTILCIHMGRDSSLDTKSFFFLFVCQHAHVSPIVFNSSNLTYFEVCISRVDKPLVDLITDTHDIITLAQISNQLQFCPREYLKHRCMHVCVYSHIPFVAGRR